MLRVWPIQVQWELRGVSTYYVSWSQLLHPAGLADGQARLARAVLSPVELGVGGFVVLRAEAQVVRGHFAGKRGIVGELLALPTVERRRKQDHALIGLHRRAVRQTLVVIFHHDPFETGGRTPYEKPSPKFSG